MDDVGKLGPAILSMDFPFGTSPNNQRLASASWPRPSRPALPPGQTGRPAGMHGPVGKLKLAAVEPVGFCMWLWVKKMPPLGTKGFGLFFLLPIGFFRYPF